MLLNGYLVGQDCVTLALSDSERRPLLFRLPAKVFEGLGSHRQRAV